MEFTQFSESMIPDIVDLWNTVLSYDRISEERLQEVLSCPYFKREGALVAEANNCVVGFVLAMHRKSSGEQSLPETGFITALVIRPAFESTDLGMKLIARAEHYLRSRGVQAVKATAFPGHYFFPGIDTRYTYLTDLFFKAGFEKLSEPVDMETTWDEYAPPCWLEEAETTVASEGLTIDWARPRYHDAFLEFLRENFSGQWYERAREHMKSGKDLKCAVLTLAKAGNVVGFVRFGVEGDRGYIDSIGVHNDYRKKKAGGVLLCRALQGMADRGAKRGFFGYTGAVRFYEKVGATIVRQYIQFKKEF